MPYRTAPDGERRRRADLLERKADNRRQAAALAQELATLGARSRALRDRLAMLRDEHEHIEDRLAGVEPKRVRRERLEADDDRRSSALIGGLIVATTAALLTVGAILGARAVANAALTQSWSRWSRWGKPTAATVRVETRPALDHRALRHAFAGSSDERNR